MGPVFLVGMMGSGKTAVARRVAELRGAAMVDLDRRVAVLAGRTVVELFAGEGEPGFRARERAALASLVAEPGFAAREVWVATGGGTVVDPDSRAIMSATGIVVLLEVPIDVLVTRLADDAGSRPLLGDDPAGSLAALWRARAPAYRERARVVDGVGSIDEVAARVIAAVVEP